MNDYEMKRDWYYQKKNVKPITEEKARELYNSGAIIFVQLNFSSTFPVALTISDSTDN